nr:exportin T [Hymenolepis microstoma]
MNDILIELANVDLSTGGAANKTVIDMINQLSTNGNWEHCANFIISNFERASTQKEITNFTSNAAFYACCGSLEKILKQTPAACAVTPEEVEKMSDFLRKWVKIYIASIGGRINCTILKKKIAQCVGLAVMRYYPQNWPTIFDEILSLFTDCGDTNVVLLNLLDIFLELLNELDTNAFDRSLNLDEEQFKRTSDVKDAMRASCLPAIIEVLTRVLENLNISEPRETELISTCLGIIGRYTLWIDINLIYNEKFLMILRAYVQLTSPSVLRSVCFTLQRLFAKGMPDFPDKLSLIMSLWPDLIQKIIAVPVIANTLRRTTSNQSLNNVNGCEDSEETIALILEFAKLIQMIGTNLIKSYEALAAINPSINASTDVSTWQVAYQSCVEKIEVSFDIAINLIAYNDGDVAVATATFVEEYLDLLREKKPSKVQRPTRVDKRLNLTEERIFKLSQLLTVLFDNVKYPTDDPDDDLEQFESNRKVFISFIRGIARADSALVLDGIYSLLQHTLSQLPQSNYRVEDIDELILGRLESSLYLFFIVGELYKAPKEGYFADSFEHGPKMREIMSMICASNISSIPFFPIQLNFFEVIGRYDRFFSTSPKYLLNVLEAFLDSRGLRNSNIQVRSRCAYLFSRFIKYNKSAFVPHTEQILQQLEGLLPIDPTPEIAVSSSLNGFKGSSNVLNENAPRRLFSVAEQSFLYEACATLIVARATANDGGGVPESARLFAFLLQPALVQFPEMVRQLAAEKNPEIAEARGSMIKQSTDLITRTTRVLPSSANPEPHYVQILMEVLSVLVSNLALLPPLPGAPGRGFVCAGVRAYIHRLVGYIGPDCNVLIKPSGGGPNGDTSVGHSASDLLLQAIVTATPYLVAITNSNDPTVALEDQDIRWKELKEHIPLFSQLVLRYKNRCLQALSECLPPLIAGTMSALAEPLDPSQMVAVRERVDLRQSLLQLLQTVGQVLSQDILVALGPDAGNILINLAGLTGDCLQSSDAVGMKFGFTFFLTCIQRFASSEDAFYEGFLLPHLLPLAFLSPARQEFILTDAQFSQTLHEAASCIYAINTARGETFRQFLRTTFLPQQNLAQNMIELFIEKLSTLSLKDFQVFVQNFYSSFR